MAGSCGPSSRRTEVAASLCAFRSVWQGRPQPRAGPRTATVPGRRWRSARAQGDHQQGPVRATSRPSPKGRGAGEGKEETENMRVTDLKTFIVHPGVGLYRKNLLFVRVETDDGLHGWGECYT